MYMTIETSYFFTSRPGRFTFGKEPQYPVEQEAGWGPKLVWKVSRQETFLAPAEN
jgi:hypothetical protein